MEEQIVSNGSYDPLDFFSGTKDSNAKKESFCSVELQDCSPNLPLRTGQA